MRDILFLAVNYNNHIDTMDFINSLVEIDASCFKVRCVILDNSDLDSEASAIQKIADLHAFVRVLRPPANLGYFGAFNYYFDNPDDFMSDIVVLCNNDLKFASGFLRSFNLEKYPKDVLVVCPNVVTLDGVHQNPHVLRPRNSLQRLKLDLYFSHYYVACLLRIFQSVYRGIFGSSRRLHSSDPGYLHMGIGACYILLPSFLNICSRLDFPHFLYGEEAYLSRQVHDSGGKLYYDPDLDVLHKESATLSKLPARTTYEFGRDGYYHYRSFY